MSTEANYSEELLLLAETLGEVKTRTERLEAEFATNAKPIENATGALAAALAGIKALQFHVVDNNLGALSARVEEMRKAVDEQVGVIALELKKADETNAAKAGADAETLRFEILALESKLESLVTQFGQQLERVEFAAKEEAKKLQLIPGPAGASLNPRGVFIDGETYNRLDVVSWLGSSYIATVDGVTEKPSKNSNQWQVLASRGGNAGGASTLALTDVYGKPSNGQLLIGNGADYVNATLTAGNGIAVTNGSGSITIEATGAVNYQGAWNASTNSPTLTSSVGTKGYYYVVSVAGSTNLNGITDWQAGDWAVFNGTAWEKIDNTDRVSSVFGRTGAVVGVSTDYSSVGITNTAIGASNPSTGAFTTLSATGNATVGGTLTVSGASASIVGTAFFGASSDVQASRAAAGVLDVRHPSNTTSRIDVTGATSAGIGYRQSGVRDWFVSAESTELRTSCLTANSVASYESGVLVRVRDTTASTTTSSGALVVGNGTSGGLGVGGNAYIGGDLVVASNTKGIYSQGYVTVKGLQANYFARGTSGGWTSGLHFYSSNTDVSASIFHNPSTGDLQFYTTASASDYNLTTDRALVINTSKQVQVLASTSSNNTSTGALVVSGGVGVAGAINAGGNLTNGEYHLTNGTSTHARSVYALSGTGKVEIGYAPTGYGFGHGTGSYLAYSDAMYFGAIGGANPTVTLSTAGAITLTGSVTTGAPTGGTAAAWKLGTVASVSPTSPNRTIEVDIGGTIYYIHAKTTNN